VFLNRLLLVDYRLQANCRLELGAAWVAFTGPNGTGKTNLLDAVHFLCLGRSYFTRQDGHLVRFGTRGFRLEGWFGSNNGIEETRVSVVYKPGVGKEMAINEVVYPRLSEHLGRMPVVMIAPGDTVLLEGSGAERRRFVDMLLAQTQPDYVQALLKRDHLLSQRNALLKAARQGAALDSDLMACYDEELVHCHQAITGVRAPWVEHFGPLMQHLYRPIAGETESAELTYVPDQVSYGIGFQKPSIQRELEAGYTLWGTQRDDWDFDLSGQSVRRYASQGQRKSYLLALKLAQCAYFLDCGKPHVTLLVDEFFEKLDQNRLQGLVMAIQQLSIRGVQVFLSDTGKERVQKLLDLCQQPCLMIDTPTQ
jgi:DNA replication and repair protein RecF